MRKGSAGTAAVTAGVAVVMILLLLLMVHIPSVSCSDELKRVLLRSIISMDEDNNKAELFSNYGELALAKAKTQAVIQSMPGYEVSTETGNWVNLLIEIINEFEAMTMLSSSEEPSAHISALDKAEAINHSIYRLRGYETPERNGIPLLLELALKRFYRQEGLFFQTIAARTGETRLKIEYEYISAATYKLGGMPGDATRMEFEARRDEHIYRRDMKRAGEYMRSYGQHLQQARYSRSALFGAPFMEIIKARDSFEHAKALYAKHEDEELERVKVQEAEIEAVYRRLMLDTLKVVALYLVALSFITAILWMDFARWHDELEDTLLGKELVYDG